MCVCSNQYSRARLCCEDKQHWKMAQFRDPVSIGRRISNEVEEKRIRGHESTVQRAQRKGWKATDGQDEKEIRGSGEVHQGGNQSRAEPFPRRALQFHGNFHLSLGL